MTILDTDPVPLEERRRDKIRASTMERHAQTIIGGLILAAILGIGGLLLDLRDRMTRSEEGRIALSATVNQFGAQLQVLANDRYTATDARRELGDVYKRLLILEALAERLDKKDRNK